jgi:Na+/proline symporter
MNDQAFLNAIDHAVFAISMVATTVLGLTVARHARRNPRDYFLGEHQ